MGRVKSEPATVTYEKGATKMTKKQFGYLLGIILEASLMAAVVAIVMILVAA